MIGRDRLKSLRALARKKDRRARGELLIEGPHAVAEAARAGLLRELLVAEPLAGRPDLRALADRGRDVALTTLDEAAVHALADTRTPSGVFGVARDPCRPFEPDGWPARAFVLLAAGVADPGNLGTLLRTAAGLGLDAVVVTPGSVEPTNPKVVRASAGALFRIAVRTGEPAHLARAGFTLWTADARGEPIDALATRPARLALAVGNEPRGVSAAVGGQAERAVAVPLHGRFESLNVAAAGAILLHALRALPDPDIEPDPAAPDRRSSRP